MTSFGLDGGRLRAHLGRAGAHRTRLELTSRGDPAGVLAVRDVRGGRRLRVDERPPPPG